MVVVVERDTHISVNEVRAKKGIKLHFACTRHM